MGFVSPFCWLGCAALLVLLAGPAAAQDRPSLALPALDLPKLDLPKLESPDRAAPPRAVPWPRGAEACPTLGTGFVRLPGSRTCLRLSGRVAAGLDLRADRAGAAARPDAAGRFALDTRTDTDLGPVRTYLRVGSGHR
ncbi:porin [Methylobacterium radiodurans]|uniref:Porin n=1 Tax=Methylobacterium radiodurans TaxID=2202828 RepID=A0A2U8VXZ5_9HYPH|nr:porin [Methylobacterium radiodurans]AWN38328.1 hypothetical protein DK427_23410 [Methylobacterium radiodurans]